MHLKGCAPGFCYQENVAAPKQVEQAYNILKTEGLSPETSRYLLESNGYRLGDTSQLSSLLDDGEEDLLQREEVKGRAVEEFETESDELEEKKVEFPERGISMEVIEFDKEFLRKKNSRDIFLTLIIKSGEIKRLCLKRC